VRFVDTNVLLYAISTAPDEAPKAAAARALLERRDLCLSTQVLQEFYVQATRPSRPDALPHADAVDLLRAFGRFPTQPVTVELVHAAADLRSRFGLAYWDAAIIEAARRLGSDEVLSEDLDDGTDFLGVRVTNPFA
jgi:predicted nucleic acid-binding protein